MKNRILAIAMTGVFLAGAPSFAAPMQDEFGARFGDSAPAALADDEPAPEDAGALQDIAPAAGDETPPAADAAAPPVPAAEEQPSAPETAPAEELPQ